MRTASHTNGKDLAKEITLLKAQLEELTESMSGTGHSMVAKREEAVEETFEVSPRADRQVR